MCGIAGEINFRTQINNEIIREMSRALTPRGPDADGLFEHEHVCLAHRRLIVIDPENGFPPTASCTTPRRYEMGSKSAVTDFSGTPTPRSY